MKDEKDRFGEKFVERAEEDHYFAAKDRELIDEMKVEFQKAQAARRKERILSCPKCAGKLDSYTYMEFVLDRCGSCGGIWLDKGKLEGIVRRAARGPLGAFLDRCFSKNETGKKSQV
jgi:Zn-finger nucleic acid-binding protein